MSDTSFRTWMNQLLQPDGDRPEWPLLLQLMLEDELGRQQAIDRAYAGKRILIPRDDHEYSSATGEKRAVYGLYHRCLERASGCLTIGQEDYWLLSYEVPNQGKERMRRADLVGISRSGGLVVFEGKLADNPYPPVSAVLEGLDYLACLTSEPNFVNLQEDFQSFPENLRKCPEGFERIEPTRNAEHTVVVLAPRGYYEKYSRSKHGLGWKDMASAEPGTASLRIRFATAELEPDGSFSDDVTWTQAGQ